MPEKFAEMVQRFEVATTDEVVAEYKPAQPQAREVRKCQRIVLGFQGLVVWFWVVVVVVVAVGVDFVVVDVDPSTLLSSAMC